MNILLLNVTGYSGSTGKIITNLKDVLSQKGHRVCIGYGHTETINEPQYYKFCTSLEARIASLLCKFGRAQYKGNPLSLCRIKKIIIKEKPDIVHVHCINGQCVSIYKLFEYLASNNIKTVITHHAEFLYTGSCAYAFECRQFITKKCHNCPRRKMATANRIFSKPERDWQRMYDAVHNFSKDNLSFVAVSPWVKERSLMSGIVNQYPCEVVLNGVDTSIFKYYSKGNLVLNRVPNCGKRLVLHVTHNFNPSNPDDIKGGFYVVKLAEKMPGVTFIVVDASGQNRGGHLPSNLFYWGNVTSPEELAVLYSTADVTLLTSKRETFSMVTVESLCCGTPVVGFNAGGPESIAINSFCKFVEFGRVNLLQSELERSFTNVIDKGLIAEQAAKKYSKEIMSNNYLEVYKRLHL